MPGSPPADAMVLSAREGAVTILTLNRPNARNALSEEMIAAMRAALDEKGRDPSARVVVIAANGPAFSAGHDLKEIAAHRQDDDRGRHYFDRLMRECAQLMQTIVRCPKPVIAEVQGVATAAGCQLVASCDLAVAAEGATFATPGVNIGLFCSTPMVALSRNVARKEAMEMLLTGEMIAAVRAREIGLVNRVVPADALRAETLSLAQAIAAKSGTVLAIGKEAFYRQLELGLSSAYDYASEVMTRNLLEADAEEGICAFIEKRAPAWR